jgi:hypothetical protein
VYERSHELVNTLLDWVDSDWAADLDSRRSHTCYVLMPSGGAVSWKSRRQDCVSLSTSEAEYVAASQCEQEVVYLRWILRDFGFTPIGPTRVYEDNLACVATSEKPVRRKYSRHIDIRRYFVRDLVQNVLKLVPREICGQNLVETVSVRCVRDNVWYIHIDVYIIYCNIYIYIYSKQ